MTYTLFPTGCADETTAIQAALDKCAVSGGTVELSAGVYPVSGLLLHSHTTVLLKKGAILLGSTNCDDYPVFPVPEGVVMQSDMEMISDYYRRSGKEPWPTYRRAMLSAYGETDIAILGEEETACILDGQNCYDPDGEENYRGPHGIYLSCCTDVTLRGYTCRHSGNFMHQVDGCRNLTMEHVTCLGGSDGIHLHACEHTLISDCTFRTGDDTIAGINIVDLTVRRCYLNTSCNVFRMGGEHILVEDTTIEGPGEYPHRMTVVKSREEILPKEAGRHNTLCVLEYFSSLSHPKAGAGDIVFRRCTVKNAERFLHYDPAHCTDTLQLGTPLTDITLEDVSFSGLLGASIVCAPLEHPLTVYEKGVTTSFRTGAECNLLFDHRDPGTGFQAL